MNQPDAKTSRRPERAAFIIAAVLAALGALLISEALQIPDKGGYAGVGSAGMPKTIGGGLIVLAIWTVIAALREPAAPRPHQEIGPVVWIIAGLGLQLVLLQPLGFSIATGLLFACTAAAFGMRKFTVSLPVGIALACAVYGVFDRILQLNLPAGPLENLIFGG